LQLKRSDNMLRSVKVVVSDTAQTMVKNESTAFINRLLNQNAASEPLHSETPGDAEIAAGALSLVQGPAKIVSGAVMMVGGVFLSAIPRTVMSVGTTEVSYQEESTSRSSVVQSSISSLNLAERKSRTPFHYTRKGEVKTYEGDEPVAQIDEDKTVITRPRLPLIDPPAPVMDLTKENIPVAYAEVKTSVTGYGLFTTGLTTVISGAIDPLVGVSKMAFFGGKKLYNHIKSKNDDAAENKEEASIKPKRD
jgi:hypothetical protein